MLNDLYQALDPIAFSIGPYSVRWYGLAYLFGFVCAGFVIYRTAKRWRLPLKAEDVLTLMVCIAFGGIIGARLFYVLFYNLEYYIDNPLHIIYFNEGGMSFHGGLVGAVLGGAIGCKLLGLRLGTMADLAVIGAPLGLLFGRFANFVNGELWGKPTDLPWGVVFESGGPIARHPSQLYEAVLEGVVIFIVLYALSRRMPPRPRGTFISVFLILYGVFRFAVEFVRVPDAQIGYMFGWITRGQMLSVPLVIVGIALLIYSRKRNAPQTLVR